MIWGYNDSNNNNNNNSTFNNNNNNSHFMDEHSFFEIVRNYIISLLLFMCFYSVSYVVVSRYRAKNLSDDSDYEVRYYQVNFLAISLLSLNNLTLVCSVQCIAALDSYLGQPHSVNTANLVPFHFGAFD